MITNKTKVTKTKLLKYVNNDMTTCWYYLVYCRVYNQDNTRYKKAKFVLHIDLFDILEYFESDYYNASKLKEYLYTIAYGVIDFVKYDKFVDFIDFCNDTINKYNGY